MSTVNSKTSEGPLQPLHVPTWVRYLDFVALAVALPIFIVAGFPIAGYLVGGGAWVVQRVIQIFVQRKAASSRDPRTIVGLTAGSMIGRGWFCAIAIFLVGIIDSNAAGLAAALLVVALFTLYFALGMVLRPFDTPLRPKGVR